MVESSWTLVAEFSADTNLLPVCRQLDYLRIRYRVNRETGQQQLWVSSPEQVETTLKVLALFEQERKEQERKEQEKKEQEKGEEENWEEEKRRSADEREGGFAGQSFSQQEFSFSAALNRFPVVIITILLGILGAMVVRYQFDWVHWFTFQDFVIKGSQIGFYSAGEGLQKGEYWRLLTPAFLHFGLFHIAFNGLWVWEFGRRIEWLGGSRHMLMVLLVTAVISNIAQYWWGGPSLFGGLSGVVYGLLGYLWIRNRAYPHPATALPPGILGFLLFWLVICMTGIVGALMGSAVANAAHTGGLLTGMFLGGGYGLIARAKQG